MVAHEVKGYLGKNAAVLASIAEGDYGAVPDPLKSTARAALTDTRAGVNTVMDILQGSNLGSGSVQYTMRPFDLRQALAAVVTATRPLAQSKGLALEFVDDGTAYTVSGDETKIRDHVLRNLVENAVRYTPKGSVAVGVSRIEGNAVAWVKDTGVGITPEDMQKLFTEGGHGENSRAVNPSSTGFGLFIAKQIVDAHHGSLWAESEGAGTGSRFYLLLPLYTAAL
jgi:signal transduction histidine kinase